MEDLIEVTTVWGHEDSIEEESSATFTNHWLGSGETSGTSDEEKIQLDPGEYMEDLNIVHPGEGSVVTLQKNKYGTGGTSVLKYRTASTVAGIFSATWTEYTVPFSSLGYVQIRIENVD